MTRDETITNLAQIIVGLQVPMSLGIPLGTAVDPWRELHCVIGFGWHDLDTVKAKLEVLLSEDDG